jgi:type IV pilus assembly protein PilB
MDKSHAQTRPLGELIVERGLISREHLEDALLEQRVSRQRLGAILVSNEAISPPELTDVLITQVQAVADVRPDDIGLDDEDDR